MPHLLSIDAGTTGVTAMLIRDDGEVVARGYREFPQSFPRPGWVEHDPAHWWEAAVEATGAALTDAGLAAGDVTAVGITNQRETTVLWDRDTLEPVHPAIVWQDRRTAPLCEALKRDGWEERIRERTGLVVDPYFSATKLAWLLDEVDGVRAAAGRLAFGTVDSYLIARLTNGAVHATDHTNASRTMLYDIHQLGWDGELREHLRIPAALLPDVRPSSGRFGTTNPDAFLGIDAPITGVAGDQQAALVGQACFATGDAKNTYGTGSFVLLNTGREAPVSKAGLLTTIAYSDADGVRYALEGAIFVTGAAVQWLRDGLGLIDEAAEAGPLAESVPDTGGVFFVPALTGLGAPWWDPYARGTIGGITRGTGRAHLVRAAVEAMAYQTRDVVDVMVAEAHVPLQVLKADGGASAMDALLQFQADQLGVPVRRPVVQETTGLGAAYLAGLGAGIWSSKDDVARNWRLDREFIPGDREDADARHAQWRRAVERSLRWEGSTG